MQIQTIGATRTMSSIELLDLVNQARAEFGESEVRRNDFTARCRDELEGEYYETFVVSNPRGPASEALKMTRDQCMYVLMRESKAVRRAVTVKLNEGAAAPVALPNVRQLAQMVIKAEDARELAEAERDEAIRTKALIGSKREATAMATASAAKREKAKLREELGACARHATITAVQNATGTEYSFRPMRTWCANNGATPTDVPDKRFGKVKAWPAAAWAICHDVDLSALFGEVAV